MYITLGKINELCYLCEEPVTRYFITPVVQRTGVNGRKKEWFEDVVIGYCRVCSNNVRDKELSEEEATVYCVQGS